MSTDLLTVRQVMQPEPVTVRPTQTIGELLLLMNLHRVGSVLVCEGEARLVGIFTERDLLRRVSDAVIGWRNYPVSDWMTFNPHTIQPDIGWEDAVQAMTKLKVRHLPVIENDRVIGVLSTRMLMSRRAEHLNQVIEARTKQLQQVNGELMARDLEMMHNLRAAGRLQQKLLPHAPPSVPEFDWAVHYAPLDHLGGDYYDFAEPDADHIGFLIADASGHSIAAAVVAVMTRYAFAEVSRSTISPGAVLTQLNERLSGITEERFVSAFYGIFNRRTRVLRFANAGHPYPLHYQAATQDMKPLVAQGFLLGIIPDEVYVEREVTLAPDDRITFFTDGLAEARNEIGEQFGTDRLFACIAQQRDSSADFVADILECQRQFSSDVSIADDLTVAVCRLLA